MSETLAGLEIGGTLHTTTDEVVRAINRVKVQLIADRDRATEALREGGTYQEMNAMTTVWRVIDEGVRGLERAIGYLTKDEEDTR